MLERKWARVSRIGEKVCVGYTPEGEKVCVVKDAPGIADLEVGDIVSFFPHLPNPLMKAPRPPTQPWKYLAGSPRIIGYAVEDPRNTVQKVGQEDATRRSAV